MSLRYRIALVLSLSMVVGSAAPVLANVEDAVHRLAWRFLRSDRADKTSVEAQRAHIARVVALPLSYVKHPQQTLVKLGSQSRKALFKLWRFCRAIDLIDGFAFPRRTAAAYLSQIDPSVRDPVSILCHVGRAIIQPVILSDRQPEYARAVFTIPNVADIPGELFSVEQNRSYEHALENLLDRIAGYPEDGNVVRPMVTTAYGSAKYSTGNYNASYHAIDRILRVVDPKPGERVFDWGVGEGRWGLWIGLRYPGVRFSGVDVAPWHIRKAKATAKRFQFSGFTYRTADFTVDAIDADGVHHHIFFDPTNDDGRAVAFRRLGNVWDEHTKTVSLLEGLGGFLPYVHRSEQWLDRGEYVDFPARTHQAVVFRGNATYRAQTETAQR